MVPPNLTSTLSDVENISKMAENISISLKNTEQEMDSVKSESVTSALTICFLVAVAGFFLNAAALKKLSFSWELVKAYPLLVQLTVSGLVVSVFYLPLTVLKHILQDTSSGKQTSSGQADPEALTSLDIVVEIFLWTLGEFTLYVTVAAIAIQRHRFIVSMASSIQRQLSFEHRSLCIAWAVAFFLAILRTSLIALSKWQSPEFYRHAMKFNAWTSMIGFIGTVSIMVSCYFRVLKFLKAMLPRNNNSDNTQLSALPVVASAVPGSGNSNDIQQHSDTQRHNLQKDDPFPLMSVVSANATMINVACQDKSNDELHVSSPSILQRVSEEEEEMNFSHEEYRSNEKKESLETVVSIERREITRENSDQEGILEECQNPTPCNYEVMETPSRRKAEHPVVICSLPGAVSNSDDALPTPDVTDMMCNSNFQGLIPSQPHVNLKSPLIRPELYRSISNTSCETIIMKSIPHPSSSSDSSDVFVGRPTKAWARQESVQSTFTATIAEEDPCLVTYKTTVQDKQGDRHTFDVEQHCHDVRRKAVSVHEIPTKIRQILPKVQFKQRFSHGFRGNNRVSPTSTPFSSCQNIDENPKNANSSILEIPASQRLHPQTIVAVVELETENDDISDSRLANQEQTKNTSRAITRDMDTTREISESIDNTMTLSTPENAPFHEQAVDCPSERYISQNKKTLPTRTSNSIPTNMGQERGENTRVFGTNFRNHALENITKTFLCSLMMVLHLLCTFLPVIIYNVHQSHAGTVSSSKICLLLHGFAGLCWVFSPLVYVLFNKGLNKRRRRMKCLRDLRFSFNHGS